MKWDQLVIAFVVGVCVGVMMMFMGLTAGGSVFEYHARRYGRCQQACAPGRLESVIEPGPRCLCEGRQELVFPARIEDPK